MRRLLLLVPVLLLLSPVGSPAAPERLNVVVILTDDQTLESMRVMDRTLARLAAEGTTFSNSVVSYPLCCPSRATELTGQYAHNHKVMGNNPPDGGYGRLNHSNTLPVWLREAGYETAHVGKYLNGYTGPEVPPGWTHWFGLSDPSTYRVYDYTVIDGGRPVHYGEAESDYQTDVLARKAEEILRSMIRSGHPFFLSVAPVPPHQERSDEDARGTPPRPAPRHQGMFAAEPLPVKASYDEPDVADKPPHIRKLPRLGPAKKELILRTYRARLESLQAVDELVARLVDALQETGQLGRTVIFFTSDNGFFLGEHRIADGKLLPYEESIRVPLIVRGGGFPAGHTAEQPVANIDLAPTIVELTGARARRKMDGRSLLPLALDPALGRDRALLIEGLSRNPARPSYEAIRTSRWLWVEYHTGARELYDLQADPLELNSRHKAPALRAVRGDLAHKLARLRRCAGASCSLQPTSEVRMRRVTGIGGIFMSAKDPKALCDWYKKHLGIDVQPWGGAAFDWTDSEGNPTKGTTAWSIGPADGKHFAPSKSTFMVNYRVEDLAALLKALREEGCNVLEKTDDSEYGKFGWVMDPEGNKVELWQPPQGQ